MRRVRKGLARAAVIGALAGCGGSTVDGDGSSEGGAPGAPADPVRWALGVNDVTILVPLPATVAAPVLFKAADAPTAGGPLVPEALVARLALMVGQQQRGPLGSPLLFDGDYGRLHLVAVRFDLCDRAAPGVCPSGAPGRLRLVFQPLGQPYSAPSPADEPTAIDTALHALYTIPEGDLGAVVHELRALGAMQGTPVTVPLGVNAALTRDPRGPYAARLSRLVAAYATEARLERLTIAAQPPEWNAVAWVFQGVERREDTFVDMLIPDVRVTRQRAQPMVGEAFETTPAVASPKGLGLAFSSAFGAAAPDAQREAFGALARVDNPLLESADTVSCVACHLATSVSDGLARTTKLDLATIEGRYTSSYPVSVVASDPSSRPSVRAFGWLGTRPILSQRVANETAQVLTEIEARFPIAR